MAKSRYLRSRSPASRVRSLTVSADGVHCLMRGSDGWIAVHWPAPTPLAADIGLFTDALRELESMRTAERVRSASRTGKAK